MIHIHMIRVYPAQQNAARHNNYSVSTYLQRELLLRFYELTIELRGSMTAKQFH